MTTKQELEKALESIDGILKNMTNGAAGAIGMRRVDNFIQSVPVIRHILTQALREDVVMVPDKMTPEKVEWSFNRSEEESYIMGWNECREKSLQVKQKYPLSDLKEAYEEILEGRANPDHFSIALHSIKAMIQSYESNRDE